MIFAIDTCILLDILLPDPQFGASSRELLKRASSMGRLIICDIVYTELSPQFEEKTDLDLFLKETDIKIKHCTPDVLWQAGLVWKEYLKKGGKRENRILPDFIIGAFAEHSADILVTRDKRFFKKHFSLKCFE
jgi:predicted nucleic acid-binding protein